MRLEYEKLNIPKVFFQKMLSFDCLSGTKSL